MMSIGEAILNTPQSIKKLFPQQIKDGVLRCLDLYYYWNPIKKELTVDGQSWEMYLPAHRSPWWMDYQINNCHEPMTTQVLIDELNTGDIFWDVGSMYGYFSVVAENVVGESGEIHVFEPSTEFVRWVKKNSQSGETSVNSIALGSENSGGVIAGDTYYRETGCPDLVKIDVDGSEISVLDGMEGVLEECTPIMLLEVHMNVQNYDENVQKLWRLLTENYSEISVCYDHRNMYQSVSKWSRVESISELLSTNNQIRKKKQEGLPGDYMLYCHN